MHRIVRAATPSLVMVSRRRTRSGPWAWHAALVVIALLGFVSARTALAEARMDATTADGAPATIALVGETLKVVIDGQHAATTLEQVYLNDSDGRLEGRYLLRAGEGARVEGFSYWIGDQKIVGEVFEKETARAIYEEITGLGRDPGLLERVGEGAFTFRVFPIEPAERKRISVSYARWLPRTDGVVAYRAPVSLPGAAVLVEIRDARRIGTITSSTHALKVERVAAGHVRVTTTAALGEPTELVLRYELRDEPWSIATAVHRDAGHDGYMVLSLATPPEVAAAKATAKDVTLILDVSGSMSGPPLEHSKIAARRIVERLRDTDRVNVLLFDDDVDLLYKRPRALTEEVRDEALAFIDKITDGGGTDLALALKSALAAQIDDDRPDVLLFLTDGQSDSEATLKVASADKGDARVFTIGVGDGVEKPLLSRLAAVKRGRFLFINSPEAIEERMATLYDSIEMPVLVDVSMEVDGDVHLVRTYPRSLPDLYRHDELKVVSRVRGTGAAKVTIRGRLDGEVVAFTRDVVIAEGTARPWVGKLWAEARVGDLEEEIALTGENDELKNEVIELALAYNFATRYTSFLAIPSSELTDDTYAAMKSARERKALILAAHKDAMALSRTAMPPGDPVLSVKAPADAVQVTAYFPFGLVKDLEWDAHGEKWTTRFLVPKSVVDGSYDVKIVVVHADGTVEMGEVPYTIDSDGPDFEVKTELVDGGVRITVTASEACREVTVAVDGAADVRVDLDAADGDEEKRVWSGVLPLEAGVWDVVVVVTDAARNEHDETVSVEVPW